MKFRELGWAGGKGRALSMWHFGISSLCKCGCPKRPWVRCVIHLLCWIFHSLQKGNNTLLPLSGNEERIKPINEEKTFRHSGSSGTVPPPLTALTALFIWNAQRVFKNYFQNSVWRGKFGQYTVVYIMLTF